MDLGNGLGHLSYSTLVHPGDTWAEMKAGLTTYLPRGETQGVSGQGVRGVPAAVRRVSGPTGR
jgi:hypothetical protein